MVHLVVEGGNEMHPEVEEHPFFLVITMVDAPESSLLRAGHALTASKAPRFSSSSHHYARLKSAKAT